MKGPKVQRSKGRKVERWFILLAFLTFPIIYHLSSIIPSAWAQAPEAPGTVTIVENIKITRHNLSSTGLGAVKVAPGDTSEVCVFCHTPHGASGQGGVIKAPLWNRNLAYSTTYNLYDQAWSLTFDATLNDTAKPTGYSRLCLSCHDGVIALGSVINKPGSGGFRGDVPPTTSDITVSGAGTVIPGEMPPGMGFTSAGVADKPELTGDTRFLGTNLQNDHPISFRFDTALSNLDAELVDPGPVPTSINARTNLAPGGGYKTGAKRYGSTDTPNQFDSVQCTSCHNPHATTYPKFLRGPRFQDASELGFLPGGAGETPSTGQIICLYCHSKPGWEGSTHDVDTAVRAAYPRKDDTTTLLFREDYDFDGKHTVGQLACRACHDPHTAQGAKRLHREGVTGLGGVDAVEATCYLCHGPLNSAVHLLIAGDPSTPSNPRFTAGTRFAPDIYTEFAKDNSACRGGTGTGSGMCLQLASGHNPIFISRPQEGVQVKSEGLALVPIDNEETPGTKTLDSPHVSCVDCHNVHQVNSPNNASVSYSGVLNTIHSPDAKGEGGRFKGMKGVGIDATGTRPVIVGRCEPNYVVCGRETTINGNAEAPTSLQSQATANRDPMIYEVCFRCHGNSYTNIWGPASGRQYRSPDDISILSVPLNYASYASIPFSSRTDPTNGLTGDNFSFKGFSNKWRELNPFSQDIDTPPLLSLDLARFGQAVFSHTQQTKNPAYHPVVLPGRNGSWQLCNQLVKAFSMDCGGGEGVVVNTESAATNASASNALKNHTIQCVDCHNNNLYDTFQNQYPNLFNLAFDDSLLRGPLTESNLRATDVWPNLNDITGFNYLIDRPSKPIGPHGSIHRRILRANYDTDILRPGRCFEQNNPSSTCASGDGYSSGQSHNIAGGGAGSNNAHFQRFLLCFNCHDRRGFDPDVAASGVSSDKDPKWTRFFGVVPTAQSNSWWEGNLHMYHLRWTGAMCHECHYNVHSNVEASNTIYGDGRGGLLPPDSTDGITDGVVGTHLINFGPTVEGTTNIKPTWFYDGTAFRCYLRCHNEVMDSCAYQAQSTGTPNARWCAGGRNPGTSG